LNYSPGATKSRAALNAKLSAVLLGKGAKEKVADYFAYGADKVYWSENPAFNDFYADVYADALFPDCGRA
jgi:electron transfer flavoprotein alpha subunit